MIINFGNDNKGGGRAPKIEALTVDANGVYEAPKQIDGYSPVTVNVPTGGGSGEGVLDFGQIGYTDNNPFMLLQSNRIAQSKAQMDLWDSTTTDATRRFLRNPDIYYCPLIDTSNVTNMNMCFTDSALAILPPLNISKVENMSMCFSNTQINTLPLMDWSSVKSADSCFSGCFQLGFVEGFQGLKVSIDLKETHIDRYSVKNIVNSIAQSDPSFEASPHIIVSSRLQDSIPQDVIFNAQTKGWQIWFQ